MISKIGCDSDGHTTTIRLMGRILSERQQEQAVGAELTHWQPCIREWTLR